MKIELGNAESRVVHADEVERQWLRDFLTWENAGARFGNGARFETLLHPEGFFPSGLVPNIWRAFKEDTRQTDLAKPAALPGRTIELVDARHAPPTVDPNADVEWLRHHPAAAARGHDPIIHQLSAYQECVKRSCGIVWIPMGGGKGEVIAALCRAWAYCRILILVPENVDQLAERIERRTGITVGRIGMGKFQPFERVTVAGFQALHKRFKAGDAAVLKLLAEAEALLVDECHMLPANSMYTVAMAATRARVRIGLSATPDDRADKKNLYVTGCLGPIIYRVTPRELIDLGIISEPEIRLVPCVQRSELDRWDDVYDELVVKSDQRNDTVVNMALVAARPGFVFVERELHGFILKRMLAKAGLNVEFVWGDVTATRRKDLVKQMLAGRLDLLVCSGVFRQGLDVPTLASVVNAAGRASTIWTLQRLGRGARADAATDKYAFEYWDVLDHGQRWLEKHTEQRVAAFRQEGYIPRIVEGLEAPDPLTGEVPDFRAERSGIEVYREEKKRYRDALFELTGLRHIRSRR